MSSRRDELVLPSSLLRHQKLNMRWSSQVVEIFVEVRGKLN